MILIGLGANLSGVYGTPEQCIKAAITLLIEAGIAVTHISHIWKTAPVPVSDQPWYRNAVCVVDTPLAPHALLKALASIEDRAGRQRRDQNEARVLDLDLLVYHDDLIDDENLSVPHPRMHERAFVLYPLYEVNPDWVHPQFRRSVRALMDDLPDNQAIECIEGSQMPLDQNQSKGDVRV